MSVAWWIWLLAGLALMAVEVLTPGGFFAFFLGCAALLVGLLTATGAMTRFDVQGLAFVVLSAGTIILLRKPLVARFPVVSGTQPVDQIQGQTAIARAEIAVGAYGQVELRGSSWQARNVGETAIAAAARCTVERVDGLTLMVRNSN